MKPIEFEGSNVVIAKDQPEYLPLPAYRSHLVHGTTISCWQLTWRERIKVLFSGRLWLSQLTFHDPLQPQLPSVDKPELT